MPVSSYVLTFPRVQSATDQRARLAVVERLRAVHGMRVGDFVGVLLPVVAETSSIRADKQLFDWLGDLPEVVQVELVFHDLSDAEDFGDRPPSRRNRGRNSDAPT